MEDTPALPLLYHCHGPLCTDADEIAQPANHFFWFRSNRSRYCKRCLDRVNHSLPTKFDLERSRLGLNGDPAEWASSKELRQWTVRHANFRFVPEALLAGWNIRPVIEI